MKQRISRISRRTVSMVLALLMMVSVLGFGSLITANAWNFSNTYLHISFDNGTNWTDYHIGDSAGSFTLNESKNCQWVFCCEGQYYKDNGDGKPYSGSSFNETSGNTYYAKTYGNNNYSATLSKGKYTFNFTNRYNQKNGVYETLQYTFYKENIVEETEVTIYFKDTLGWNTAPYVYLYNSNSLSGNGAGGAGNGGSPAAAVNAGQMTSLGNSLYSIDITNKEYKMIVFNRNNQNTYGNFWSTQVAYDNSFGTHVTTDGEFLFTPNTTKDATYNGVNYYPGTCSEYFDVTIGTVNNGSISSDKSKATSGETVTLTLSPSTGYNPVAPTITKAGGGTVTPTKVSNTSYTFTMPSQAVTVKAIFTQKTYTVKKSENVTGTVKVDSTTITTGGVAIAHGSHSVTVTAPTGYNVTAVSGISGTVASGGLNTGAISYSGVSITAATTISVTYALKTYTVKKSENVTGTVQVDSTAISTSGVSITHGTHTVSITAPTGYNVTAVSGISGTVSSGGLNTGAISYSSVSITAATTISVTYAQKTYAITFNETGGSGTLKIDGTVRTSGYAVTHGSHTFRVEAPDGYVISTIEGIGTWSNSGTYATLGSTSITSAKTISVTYASAGTPTLDTIAAVANKNVNNTTFTFPVSVSDRSKASGTLTLQVTSSNTDVITIQNSPYTVSADTTNINATVAGVATGTSTITVKLYDGSTLLDTKTVSIKVTAPTFTLTNKDVYVSSKNSEISKTTSPAPSGTGSGITWTSNNTEYITVNSSGQVTAAKVPTSDQTATITATATYASGFTKTVTCTATLHTPNLSATTTAASGTIGTTATGGVTASNPNSDQIASYSWSSNASTTVAVTNGTTSAPTFTFKKPGSATITLTATYKNTGLTKTATVSITVTQPTCSFTDSSAIALGIGQTQTRSANVSAVGSAATTTLEYSGSNSYITVASDTGAVTGVKPTSSAQTVTATYTITCGGQTTTKTATYNVTVTTPTVSITSGASVNVDADLSLAASSSGATTSPTYTWSVTNGTGTASVSGSTLTGLTPGTVTVKVSATYGSYTLSNAASKTVTVNTPSISMSNVTIAKGDKVTLSATTSDPSGLTMAYELASAVSGVTISGNKLSVTGDCSASSATIVAKAKNSAGTVVAIKNNVSVTIQDPSLTIADTANESTKYLTVGTNYAKTLTSNFDGNYEVVSSNTSVATASESSGTLTVVPVAKGTATITVKNTKTASQITASSAGKSKSLSKGKLATGAAGDIEVSQTFTVNVSEAETYKYLYFENGVGYTTPKAYFFGGSDSMSWPGEAMVKIGKNSMNKDIYAIRYLATKDYSKVIISDNGSNDARVQISGTTDIVMQSDKNTIWCDTSKSDSGAGWYNSTVIKPQIAVNDVADLAVDDDATLTATVVNVATPSEYKWVSADESTATVASASTGTTATNTVTGVNAGSTTVTVKAYCAMPVFNGTALTSIVKDGTADDYVAGTATATIAVTDTPRTINFSNTLKTTSGGNYDAANANLAGTVSASYTTGGSDSGSGSGGASAPGGDTTYYLHIGKQNAFCTNTAIAFTWDATNSVYYASYNVTDLNSDIPFVINTTSGSLGDGNKSSSTQAVHSMNNSTYNPDGLSFNYFYYATYNGFDCFKFGVNSSRTLYFTFASAGSDLIVRSSTNYTPGSGSGGGSGSGSSSPTAITDGDTVPNGSDVTFTVDSVTAGYRFVGWEENGTVVETATTYTKSGVRANYTVHARFEKGINVTFKDYDDTVLQSSAFYFTDGTDRPAAPDDPTRTDYTFTGWSSNGGSTTYTTDNIPAVSGTADIIYIAQYRAVVYSATGRILVSNNGTSYTDVSTYDNSHKISVSTADNGATFTIKNTNDSDISDPTSMTAPASVKLVATAVSGYELVGIYRVHSDMSEEEVTCSTSADNSTKTCSSYSFTTENEPGYNFVAKFKKIHYITLYNTYELKNDDFVFKAAPPRKVKVGTGGSAITYTYASGTALQRGEDIIATADGTSGTYYEGNRIPVVAGDQVQLTYSGLASSEAITGIFYNNAIRYTHELELDNKYVNRETHDVDTTVSDEMDDEGNYLYGDDNWGTGEYGTATGYTYLSSTTLFADENFYDSAIASVISAQTYVSTVDNTDHTVTWTPQGDYLNIDLELSSKYRIFINNGDWNGIEVKNSTYNAEGYYYPGETINGDTGIEVSLDTSDSTKHFSFTDVNSVKKKTGDSTYVDDAHLTLTKTDGKYYIQGTDADNKDMPAYDLYVTIGVKEEYNMKLGNVVVSDEIFGKMMLTETNQNVTSKPATATDYIGTITAVPTLNSVDGADISSDGNWWVNNTNEADYRGRIYNSNTMSNSHYLNGGVNKGGTMVEAGSTVTYSFSFANGKEAEYSFVGWYEGKLQDDRFVPDYTKKLSGKTTFTYTPKKDTVIIAAGTRDMYIGGNFTSAGAYTTTSGSQTWSTGRIKMEFDPTYVNGDNKGRYYYKFDSVSANTEYKFRCYDTVSGTDTTNLTVWKSWSGSTYANNDDSKTDTDIFFSREKYDDNSHGAFMYKTDATSKTISGSKTSSTNHQANGYAAPVTVYFYAYDGGITVNSEYQWSKAYVSKGRGIDVISPDASDDAKYNAPSVSVANKTVGNKDVVIADDTFGTEAIKVCTVKEKDGKIVVTADPEANNLGHVDVQAFLVYNIETKKSEAVKEIIDNDDGTYSANITIPQNTKIYVVPIYKFTDSYISSQHLDSHTVYVRTADIDKDDWGGLVSMYSWGTDSRYDSGGWPGQLMIPSDDGETFYAPLTFSQGGLAGVTFSNYDKIWGNNHQHFVGTYKTKGVSDVDYSGNTKLYQTYDYREPIAIIENLDDDIYEDEDMDLTFELKPGNKTEAPNIDSGGSGAYNKAASFEYLTDRSGKSRVDLNGNKIDGNPTETYRIVCNYTPAYKSSGGSKTYDFTDGSRDGTTTHNEYSIDWTVYQANGESTGVSGVLSAGFIDVYKSEMLTYIASKLIDAGMPVSGRAVKIAYENPGTWGEAVRYSGQWYADSVNTLIDANVRVGIYSDGAWLPSDTNAPGYGTATVSCPTMDAGKGENLVQEFSSGYSLAKVIKSRGTNGQVQFSVDTPTNFLGWYREDGDGGYEPVGSNYKNTTITPSFNDNITYYAFYSASATYRFAYTSRFKDNEDKPVTKYYTAQGTDLTEAELAASGTLNATERAADINAKLSGINGIKVFNNTLTYTLGTPDTSTPYTITYTATQSANTYNVNVYTAVDNKLGTVTAGFGNSAVDLYKLEVGSKPAYHNPTLSGNGEFIGWKKYDATNKEAVGDYLSTQINFGYAVTEDMDIIACYGTESEKETARADLWKAYIDKNVITQELTSETTGKIYNDNIIAFRNGVGTSTPLPLDGTKECGIVILAQTNSATSEEQTQFNTRGQSSLLGYANNFIKTDTTSGRMNTKYGEAYAFKIKAESLSELNRIDLCQILDYAKFSGGKFKVMSYYYDGSVATTADNYADAYKCSDVISKTYTVG